MSNLKETVEAFLSNEARLADSHAGIMTELGGEFHLSKSSNLAGHPGGSSHGVKKREMVGR